MLMDRGVLVRWNDEKGFGFIQPEKNAAQDVFIHISVLKKMARKPIVGDSILYQTEVQNDGKRKAVIASIEGVAVVAASADHQSLGCADQWRAGRWLNPRWISALAPDRHIQPTCRFL